MSTGKGNLLNRVENIKKREEELVKIAFDGLTKINGLHILAGNVTHRLGAISFYIENIHYNLVVKILNDKFGIQVRGGCSCAGTYGHYLLHVTPAQSKHITEKINHGDLSEKPGWVRMSIHPTMTNDEIYLICNSIKSIQENISVWQKDYQYLPAKNEFVNIMQNGSKNEEIKELFKLN